MKIGLIDVDGHNYPNFALMKISAYHKMLGNCVEWYNGMDFYDIVYISKIFTYTPDENRVIQATQVIRGGTGYDITKKLPAEIEAINTVDYTIYPQYEFSIQFFSRGCIRKCQFCLAHIKEGSITPAPAVNFNPKGKHVEVLDNNFFANPQWEQAIQLLIKNKQKVNFHGVDVRIMNEKQAAALNKLKLQSQIHIAWDQPDIDLKPKLQEVIKYIKPSKLQAYVLIGFNSTIEQDIYRIETLRELKIDWFVQPYRDFTNERKPTQYEKDFASWANKRMISKVSAFNYFEPRKGFLCNEYLKYTKHYIKDIQRTHNIDIKDQQTLIF